jgi:hypothetical protein
MTVESGCDDPDSPTHNNSVVSRQSISEIAGTSGIQPNKFQAAFKISSQEILHIPQAERKAESQQKTRSNCSTHTFAFPKLLNKLFECEEREKDDKEEVEYKIAGTPKESTQRQRKSVNNSL